MDRNTPEQRAADLPPLDDDERWLPIEAAHRRRDERTCDGHLATFDLEERLAQGDLPCMARSRSTRERILVAPTDWTDRIKLMWTGKDSGLDVLYRPHPEDRDSNVLRRASDEWVYYVSQAHLDRIWRPRGEEPVLAVLQRERQIGKHLGTRSPEQIRQMGEALGLPEAETAPEPQEPPPQKPRKRSGGGRTPLFTQEQRERLRDRYRHDLEAKPELADNKSANKHVRKLAEDEFGIVVGDNSSSLLTQIIRPVRKAASQN
jgi:hypothetical protein